MNDCYHPWPGCNCHAEDHAAPGSANPLVWGGDKASFDRDHPPAGRGTRQPAFAEVASLTFAEVLPLIEDSIQ